MTRGGSTMASGARTKIVKNLAMTADIRTMTVERLTMTSNIRTTTAESLTMTSDIHTITPCIDTMADEGLHNAPGKCHNGGDIITTHSERLTKEL